MVQVLPDSTRTVNILLSPSVQDITVNLNGSTNYSGTSDINGQVNFKDITFGTYTIEINDYNYNVYTQKVVINNTNNNPRIIPITLTPKE
ncbi:prealbumin-like fold domain-containing protein [Methanosphaera cuniculi]|uniref:PEGA domain-containing protein n=1 Tax=Methanosphaera cuniculi TaxID=1077256 RepID=A0A2A2HDP2_9EURY|nr:prealbumin-like fold domain-containing protein [Methanosphaera cuniculi]PAV07611.1 hypothetical protein ASJ82_08015 [Methanosphaera cuniculi]